MKNKIILIVLVMLFTFSVVMRMPAIEQNTSIETQSRLLALPDEVILHIFNQGFESIISEAYNIAVIGYPNYKLNYPCLTTTHTALDIAIDQSLKYIKNIRLMHPRFRSFQQDLIKGFKAALYKSNLFDYLKPYTFLNRKYLLNTIKAKDLPLDFKLHKINFLTDFITDVSELQLFLDGAAITNNIEIANLLITKGADVNAKDAYDGKTALMHAAKRNFIDLAKLLITKGADVNAKDLFGKTALMYAAKHNSLETAQLLIANNADVNSRLNNCDTALIIAVNNRGNKLDLIKILLDNGANNNIRDHSDSSNTLLIKAIKNHDFDLAKLLIESGANLNMHDTDGLTPLMLAASRNLVAIAELLISKGACINIKNQNGDTALSLALTYKNNDVADLIQKKSETICIVS